MSEEEKDNVFKINVPIFTNEELRSLDDMIENDIDNIINQISKTISKDREVIFLKKVIDKLQKENANKDKVIDLMAEHLFNVGKMPYRTNIFTKEELIQKYYEEVGDIE